MPRFANPYEAQTPYGQGLSKIAAALIGRRGDDRGELLDSQAGMYDAHRELYGEQARKASVERQIAERLLGSRSPEAMDAAVAASFAIPAARVRAVRSIPSGPSPTGMPPATDPMARQIGERLFALMTGMSDQTVNPEAIAKADQTFALGRDRERIISGDLDASVVGPAYAATEGKPLHHSMPGGGTFNLFDATQRLPEGGKGGWSDPYQLGGAWVQKNENSGEIRTAVTRPAQTRVDVPPPVTVARVNDPADPTRMLEVDARTYKGGTLGAAGVIGVSGRESEPQKREGKRQFSMQGIGETIQRAEDLLGGVRRVGGVAVPGTKPTGSGVGAVIDTAASWVGATPSGAAEAQELKAVAGALTSKMPRMEGPQSDRDTALYREMAAEVGNDRLPVERRVRALDAVRELWSKYERLNPGTFADRQPAPPGGAGGWSITPVP